MKNENDKANPAECLVVPIRRAFSKDELIKEALEFKHRDEVFAHLDHEGRQEFRAELGMLVQFCTELFNSQISDPRHEGSDNHVVDS